MPISTYTPLANVTLSSTATSVSFDAIDASYSDYVVVVSAKLTTGSAQTCMRFNGSTASQYNTSSMNFNSSSGSGSGYVVNDNRLYASYNSSDVTSTEFNNQTWQVMDAASSAYNKHRNVLVRSGLSYGGSSDGPSLAIGRWATTTQIESIRLLPTSSSFAAGSSFALYGIL